MNVMKKFYIGVKALIMKNEKLLLIFDSLKDYWEVPGGRVEGGETFKQSLARELKEEIGYSGKISSMELIAASRLSKDIDNSETTLALLFYQVDLPELGNIRLSEEHTKYEWVNKEMALSRVGPEFKSAISKVWE